MELARPARQARMMRVIKARLARGVMQENSIITQRPLVQIHAKPVKQASTMPATMQRVSTVLQIQPHHQAAANVPTAHATKASRGNTVDLARPARQARMMRV